MAQKILTLEKHLFSIYKQDLLELINLKDIIFHDKILHNRLTNILRIKSNEKIVFFDNQINIEVEILKETFNGKKKIYAKLLKQEKNKALVPEIIFCPSLLKKNNFEEIVYVAAQMGVSCIQPIITQKSSKKCSTGNDRLKKIMISACEQSKNFVIPYLNYPIFFDDFLKKKLVKENSEIIKKIFFEEKENN
ncbi:RsmE family RNA methyltransferase, partial [Candidatus Dependentiae bacterium]